MKNTLKTLGIICIIAAAFLITSCGPFEPVTPSYTVTYDSDGGTTVSSQTIEEGSGDVVRQPTAPTKTVLTTPGLYKNFTGYGFDGWYDGANKYTFGGTLTSNITLKAKWKIPDGVEVTPTGNDDLVTKAFAYFNASGTPAPTVTDKYTLYINTDVNPAAAALTLTKANANLTITSDSEREIKSPNLSTAPSKVFLTVGVASGQNTSISLTLKNVVVVGSGVATGDSLIRVMNGASLILDNKATIEKHENSVGTTSAPTSNGTNGNGAVICVVDGGNLTIKSGAVIQDNKSTGNQSNKNLVGGIYAIGTAANKAVINIEGGDISNNKCTDGNTADVYITEDVILHMKGNLTIGELAINSDNGKYPDFQIDGKVTNKIKKLNLRSSVDSLKTVQDAWIGKVVFRGTATYDIIPQDVAQFELWEFTGTKSLRGANAKPDDETTWENWINPDKYKIELVAKSGNTPSQGKFVEIK
jgi:hypothetical protein